MDFDKSEMNNPFKATTSLEMQEIRAVLLVSTSDTFIRIKRFLGRERHRSKGPEAGIYLA